MPGGSPTFPDTRSIEQLYEALDAVFAHASRTFTGMTLSQYHDRVRAQSTQRSQELDEALA